MYQSLAKFYEKLNDDCDQRQWSHYLIGLLARETGKVPSELRGADLACGTGRLTALLAKSCGIEFASDLSKEMLGEAQSFFGASGLRIPLISADLRKFRTPHRLDFVNAANDAVNYLPQNDLGAFFRAARAGLRSGGVLLFDLSSPYKLRKVLGNNLFFDDGEELSMFWQSELQEDSVCFRLTFFEREGGLYRRFEETQRQYIHEPEAVETALRDAGFSRVSVYRAFTFDAPGAEDLRIQFAAKV